VYLYVFIHRKFAELSSNLSGISVQEELAIIVQAINDLRLTDELVAEFEEEPV
jgi:hypothetical protein